MNNLSDEEYIKFLHNSLNEWLEKSRGTGIFYITGERDKYIKNEM
jgi:UDP-2,3-diacylglucosamine pyrophosphatase LpxH